MRAAASVDLEQPDWVLTSGPYAFSRHPMYRAWDLLHVGFGILLGTGWVCVTWPVAAAVMNREIEREERSLVAKFGHTYEEYRLSVPLRLAALPHPILPKVIFASRTPFLVRGWKSIAWL